MQFLISGLISGVISALGMGGGVILVVILSYITQYSQQSLQTLNLLYFIPTAIFAIVVYLKNKSVDYKMAFKITSWGLIPAILSSLMANMMDTSWLRKIFALYLIGVGIMIFAKSLTQNRVD